MVLYPHSILTFTNPIYTRIIPFFYIEYNTIWCSHANTSRARYNFFITIYILYIYHAGAVSDTAIDIISHTIPDTYVTMLESLMVRCISTSIHRYNNSPTTAYYPTFILYIYSYISHLEHRSHLSYNQHRSNRSHLDNQRAHAPVHRATHRRHTGTHRHVPTRTGSVTLCSG